MVLFEIHLSKNLVVSIMILIVVRIFIVTWLFVTIEIQSLCVLFVMKDSNRDGVHHSMNIFPPTSMYVSFHFSSRLNFAGDVND